MKHIYASLDFVIMVVAQPIGDKDTGAKNGNILNSVSQNQNRQKSVDQRKDRRSKSHPHVRVRQKLRHWTGGKGRRDKLGRAHLWTLFPVYRYFDQRVMTSLEDAEF